MCGTLTFLINLPAQAHDTWLLVHPVSRGAEAIRGELTSGMAFPQADYAIAAKSIGRRGCRTAHGESALSMEEPAML